MFLIFLHVTISDISSTDDMKIHYHLSSLEIENAFLFPAM